jgi:ribosomal protein L31
MNPELRARIQLELAEMTKILDQIDQFVVHLNTTREATLETALISAIALNVHSFYTGAERIFEVLAKQVDQSFPTGQNWHRQLLEQMSVAIPNVRPAVISEETQKIFNELRRFRHVVRSIYAYQLERDRVLEIARMCRQSFPQFVQEIKVL